MSNFRETYRGSVAAWECDQYGHMNVQFYTARVSDAAASAMLAGGFGRQAFEEHRLGVVAVHAEMDYRSELHAGDLICVESGIVGAEGKKLRFLHRLFNAETGALCMQAQVMGLCFDLEQRKSVALPAVLRDGLLQLVVDPAAPPVPAALPAAVDGFMATGRQPVSPWECDRMGHLNVQFYLARFAEAEKHLLLALGYGPTRRRADGVALRPLRHRIQFKRENHEGAVLAVRSGVRAVGPDRLELYHELIEAESGILSATAEATLALDALDGSGLRALPPDVQVAAAALVLQLKAPPALPHAGLPRPPAVPPAGLFETCRGMVDRWEAEETGRMATRFYMGIFSDAAGNMLAGGAVTAESMRADGIGSAALDYTIDYVRALRTGDAYNTRTGILELRDKTWRFCHFVSDSASGELVARAEIVAVLFDLKARKSVAIPPHVRAAFTERLVAPVPAG